MNSLNFPWPNALVLRSTRQARAREYKRHKTGSSQGGQFAPREISSDVPQEMREVVNAVKKTAAQRVRAAKLKRRLMDDPDNLQLQMRYEEESHDYHEFKRASDELKARTLPDSGYTVTASGKLKKAKRQTSLLDDDLKGEGERTTISGTEAHRKKKEELDEAEQLKTKREYERIEREARQERIMTEELEAANLYDRNVDDLNHHELVHLYERYTEGMESKEKFKELGIDSLKSVAGDKFVDITELELSDVKRTLEFAQYNMSEDWEGSLVDMFTYRDKKTGFSTELEVLIAKGGSFETEVKIGGKIRDKDGNDIGDFVRTIDDEGVFHDLFKVDKQGSGFGARYYAHLEQAYYEAGIEGDIRITANIDVGGYAWARMGYDFQVRADKNLAQQRLLENYYNKHGEWLYDVDDMPETAYEIAAYTDFDGDRMGKNAMLGSQWAAYKPIDPGSPEWQAGAEYYESKGIEVEYQ